MTTQDWVIIIILYIAIPIGIFLGKNWLKAKIEGSVQHTFNEKLEVIRAELRTKEAEISALRDGILSGRATRQAAIDQRRLQAVERIWTRVSNTFVPYKHVSRIVSKVVDFDTVRRLAENDAYRTMFKAALTHIPADDTKVNDVGAERLFVSPPIWAYFSAYQTIMYISYRIAKELSLGGEDQTALFVAKPVHEVLKAALPHRAEYIDQHPDSAYYELLDELEDRLMGELTSMLEGHHFDKAEVKHSAEILRQVRKANDAEARD